MCIHFFDQVRSIKGMLVLSHMPTFGNCKIIHTFTFFLIADLCLSFIFINIVCATEKLITICDMRELC